MRVGARDELGRRFAFPARWHAGVLNAVRDESRQGSQQPVTHRLIQDRRGSSGTRTARQRYRFVEQTHLERVDRESNIASLPPAPRVLSAS